MDLKYKVGIVTSGMVVAFAAGRYTVPEKVRVETKIVEIEKKNEQLDSETNKHEKKTVITKTTKKPSGEEIIVTKTTTDTSRENNVKDVKTSETTKNEDKVEERKSVSDRVTISLLGGASVSNAQFVYGASLTKPVLGPITLGIWGLSNGTCGASVGVTF